MDQISAIDTKCGPCMAKAKFSSRRDLELDQTRLQFLAIEKRRPIYGHADFHIAQFNKLTICCLVKYTYVVHLMNLFGYSHTLHPDAFKVHCPVHLGNNL